MVEYGILKHSAGSWVISTPRARVCALRRAGCKGRAPRGQQLRRHDPDVARDHEARRARHHGKSNRVRWPSCWPLRSITGAVGTACEAARRCKKGALYIFCSHSTILYLNRRLLLLSLREELGDLLLLRLVHGGLLVDHQRDALRGHLQLGLHLTDREARGEHEGFWVGACASERRGREERCVRIKLEGEHRVGRFEGNSNVSRPTIQTARRDAYLVLGEYGQFLLERNT